MKKESLLTVEDVLKRPLFQHAEVVGGRQGLSRAIRWVHILESAQRGCFLDGGELVLSTGVGFGQDPEKWMAYLHELIQYKTAGLCVELGEFLSAVTPEMVELADHHRFPLVVFHQPVRFVEITLDLHELIVNLHTQALRALGRYAQRIQKLTLESLSLSSVLAHFQNVVHSQTFFLPTEGKALFAPAMPQSVQTEMRELLQGALGASESFGAGIQSDGERGGQGLFSISERKQVLYQPVMTMGFEMGILGIVLFEREVDEFLSLTLDYTTTAVAQCLMRKMNVQEQTFDRQDRLVDEMLENKLLVEEDVRQLLQIQPSGTCGYRAVIVEVFGGEEDVVSEEDLLCVFRPVFSRSGFQAVLRVKGQRFFLLLTDLLSYSEPRGRLQKAMAELERLTRQAFGAGSGIRYGVSRSSRQYAQAYWFFQEAEQVMQVAGTDFFEELGVYRLLLQVKEEHVSASFVEDYLGPLLAYDREHGTQFVTTLRLFLDHYDSKQEAAHRLYVSRQTLYQRLEKIRELLGEDFLSSPEKRLCLSVALRAYEWQKKGSILR
ncbi:PucR family transcriptional regulator [Tumebacillus sp. ITR2]|uniref:PucR family transcriptional regulator n=1 Tax=Tumebacillus amylolyticus TaxID=2801339 RepID=A0ABS1JGV0_9BACL|nr:PucR family transcriptional regulator [Tumebacillus amylolyticus]MBL0389460.1 PucR family transcriptional regulator [Tumebacillus amylolyticus]